ncbi:MAG: damage-control phosphatase ARMT1 family protein [Cyanobacteria bacterium P01_G01_bin.67]
MNQFTLPQLPIPPQLIVSETGSFAYYTFTHRVPAIIEQVIAENNYPISVVSQLKTLAQDVLQGSIYPLENDGGEDIAPWNKYIIPYQNRLWLDTPFYFAETYFYRRLLAATQYFTVQLSEQKQDPFALQKQMSLMQVRESVRVQVRQYQDFNYSAHRRDDLWKQILRYLLYLNLWGNRADLSLNPTKAGEFKHQSINNHNQQELVLIDDTSLVVNKISGFQNTRIDLIADNAGFELITDLMLVDFLLTSEAAGKIHLHLKTHPTFVSDAMIKDVHATLKFLAQESGKDVSELAIRLQNYLASGQLQLRDHLFWNAPLFFWEMPSELRQELAQSSLVVIKGDANYRRLIGDCHWSKTSSFEQITSYFPTACVVLRTLKSEVIVGLELNQIEQLNQKDTRWLTNGSRGIIHFAEFAGAD